MREQVYDLRGFEGLFGPETIHIDSTQRLQQLFHEKGALYDVSLFPNGNDHNGDSSVLQCENKCPIWGNLKAYFGRNHPRRFYSSFATTFPWERSISWRLSFFEWQWIITVILAYFNTRTSVRSEGIWRLFRPETIHIDSIRLLQQLFHEKGALHEGYLFSNGNES